MVTVGVFMDIGEMLTREGIVLRGGASSKRQALKVYFPVRVICPECRRKGKLEEIKLSGKGRIHTYSVIHTPTDDFKLISPYVVAIIELEEGTRITSQIVDSDGDNIEIGDEVEVVFRKIREEGDDGVISYGYKFKLK